MASTQKYFSHDVDALNDPKISIMIDDWGMAGYGYWWTLLEKLADNETNALSLDNLLLRYLSKVWAQPVETCSAFIKSLIEDYKLLDTDDGYTIWSNSLNRRIEIAEGKSRAKAEAGRKGGQNKKGYRKNSSAISEIAENSKNDTETEPEINQNNVDAVEKIAENSSAILQNSKEKQCQKKIANKRKEIKENKIKENIYIEKKASIDFYIKNIGQLSPVYLERLEDLIEEYGDNDVLNSLKFAHSKGKASIGYITKMLENQAQQLAVQSPLAAGSKYPVINAADMEGYDEDDKVES